MSVNVSVGMDLNSVLGPGAEKAGLGPDIDMTKHFGLATGAAMGVNDPVLVANGPQQTFG